MAVYLPAIKKIINPELYPYDANFFFLYTRWTLFHQTVATLVRITHLSLESLMFVLHIASVFLILLACFRLIRKCFRERASQWCGVTLVAAIAYFAMGSGLGQTPIQTEFSSQWGDGTREIFYVRFIDW